MKKNKNSKTGNDPMRSVKTPQPPQIMDPSKSPSPQRDVESPNGKIKRKQSASADRGLAPNEEL